MNQVKTCRSVSHKKCQHSGLDILGQPDERHAVIAKKKLYQVPIRRTAWVVTRTPSCGRIVPTSPIQLCVYCTLTRRQAKALVNTTSTPPPIATLGPLWATSTDQSSRFG